MISKLVDSPTDLSPNGLGQGPELTLSGWRNLDSIGHDPALQPKLLLEHRPGFGALLLRFGDCGAGITQIHAVL